MFAFIIDDSQLLEPERLALLWAYYPVLAVSAAWFLARWNWRLGALALVIWAFLAATIVSEMHTTRMSWEFVRLTHPEYIPFDPAYVRATWFAAVFPAVMIIATTLLERARQKRTTGQGPLEDSK